MRFGKRRQKLEERPSLVLSAADGTPWSTFPDEVVDTLRHLMATVIRKDPFPKRLSLVSTLRQEGNTYIARALATTAAHDLGETICLVELNWWWPAPLPGLEEAGGISAVLAEHISLDEALIQTNYPNFYLLPSGTMGIKERPIMARSDALKVVINQLSERFDYLVLDIPAVLATNDAIPLASLGTACCLVVRQGVTSMDSVRTALDDVDHLLVLGVIMNQVKLSTPSLVLRFLPQK